MICQETIKVGDSVSYAKTIGESDVYLYTGITAGISKVHQDEEYMKRTPFKKRIAHGLLIFAFATTAYTLLMEQKQLNLVARSCGFERVRYIKPVFLGDTITVKYMVQKVDEASKKIEAKVEIYNQRNELCTVATHIAKIL